MRFAVIAAAALLALAACGEQNDSGVMDEIREAEKSDAAAAERAVADGASFLEAAKGRTGARTRPSGLVYEFVRQGSNQRLPRPSATAYVLVHYEGKLPDGTVFDSSIRRGRPAEFALNEVVRGFSEAIQLMRPGDELIATFPGELGYGAEGSPPRIPPNAALEFRIQLLALRTDDGRIIEAPGTRRR